MLQSLTSGIRSYCFSTLNIQFFFGSLSAAGCSWLQHRLSSVWIRITWACLLSLSHTWTGAPVRPARELIFLIFIAFISPVWHVLMLQHDDILMTASAHIFLMNISTGPGQLWNYTKHFNYTAMWREIRECALHFFDTVNIKYLWWWCKEVVMATCQIWNWSSTVRC